MSLISRLFGSSEDVQHGPTLTYRQKHRLGDDGLTGEYPGPDEAQYEWERPQPPARLECGSCGEVTEAAAGNPSVSCGGCGEEFGTVLQATTNPSVSVSFVCPWCGSDARYFDPRPEDRAVSCEECDFHWSFGAH